MIKVGMKKHHKEELKEKTLLESHYWTIISALSLILVIMAVTFVIILNPSKSPSKTENASPEKLQNIRVNKIPIDIELKPDTHIYYVMLRPGNITGEFSIYISLTSEDSFDFYIFDKKEDIRDSTAKPIKTMLLMKNLDKIFPVKEGNALVLANSKDKDVNVGGFVEYLER